jgi:predicted DNA-binding WGR domain protein
MKPWDGYLTKVDLKNGIYGDYVFYRMQMLFDSVRELYIVFTRWGRIGEDGMNQRTPFNNLDEAKKDFCSIFKSKTGNDFNDLDNFTRVKKKYDIAKVNYTTVSHQDYLAPFDYDKAPKSKNQKEIRDLFEEISNVTMYQRAMDKLGLDNEMLPISGITKEIIKKAMEILNKIKEKVNEDTELAKKGHLADLEALTEVRESQTELSSRFYELIPL